MMDRSASTPTAMSASSRLPRRAPRSSSRPRGGARSADRRCSRGRGARSTSPAILSYRWRGSDAPARPGARTSSGARGALHALQSASPARSCAASRFVGSEPASVCLGVGSVFPFSCWSTTPARRGFLSPGPTPLLDSMLTLRIPLESVRRSRLVVAARWDASVKGTR